MSPAREPIRPRGPIRAGRLLAVAGALLLTGTAPTWGASTATRTEASTGAEVAPVTTTSTAASTQAAAVPVTTTPATARLPGHALYDQSCASCHGIALRGRRGIAPSLVGVGAGPVLFYVSTGRMPLANPKQEPQREPPAFTARQTRQLAAYIRAVGGGPPAPAANPSAGSLSRGFTVFEENCAGCHSIVARGGIAVDASVPDLQAASADQVAEAVRMGPYVMPRFAADQIDQHDLDSLARYIVWTRHPDDAGGWGIDNIGPIPEGIVAWFIGLAVLVVVARLIGERVKP